MSTYPSINRIDHSNVEQLLLWNRTLPPPGDALEAKLCAAIIQQLKHLQETNPTAYVAASRKIGWAHPVTEITHERGPEHKEGF